MGEHLRRRDSTLRVLLALLLISITFPAATILDAQPAAALPDDFTLSKTGPPDVLIGDQATFTLTAEGSQTNNLFNLSFRDVLPPHIELVDADPAPTAILVDEPSAGFTTLVWENVSDLPSGSESSVSYTVDTDADFDPATAPVGSVIHNEAGAVGNVDAFVIPDWDPITGEFTGDFTGEATAELDTPIIPFRLVKVGGGELLRGVHENTMGTTGGTTGTVFTLTLEANPHYDNTNFQVTDVLDPYLEFLGCESYLPVDNTTDVPFNGAAPANEEWPGSGPVAPGPAGGPGCLVPNTVTTLGGGETEVIWTVPLLAAGSNVDIEYGAGVAMRANCATFTGGPPTPVSLQQGRNLDNNCGESTNENDMVPWPNPNLPELLSTNEDISENTAGTCGTYTPGVTGPLFPDYECQEVTELTSAEDLVIDKAMSGGLEHGQPVSTDLVVTVSEYRDFENFAIRDLLPSGLCYVGTYSADVTAPPTDWATNDCPGAGSVVPTISIDGGAPVPAPATTVQELPDGRFEILWDYTTIPQLATLDADSAITISFDSVVRTTYRANGAPTTPVLSGDAISNTVEVSADDLLIVENSEGIDDDPADEAGTPDGDTAEGTLDTPLPSITKYVSVKDPGPLDENTAPIPNTASDCGAEFSNITWEDSAGGAPNPTDVYATGYSPGDIVCFALTADFPPGLDYGGVEMVDLLPPGYEYINGSATRVTAGSGPIAGGGSIPPDSIGSAVVSSEAVNRVVWDVGDLPNTGQQFTWVIAALINPPGANALGDITFNQQKMTTRNTAGDVFQFRDMAGMEWEEPIVQLAKGIDRIESTSDDIDVPGPQGIDFDNSYNDDAPTPQEVEAGARIFYRIDIWNEGNHDAINVEVWDQLPSGFTCADIDVASINPPSGTCVTVGGNDVIQWPGDLPLPHDYDNVGYQPDPGEFISYTYELLVPGGVAPDQLYENEAGIRSYQADVNSVLSPFTYLPEDNIDPSVTPNTVSADDQASVFTKTPSVAKAQWSGIDDDGNDSNGAPLPAPDEATIGEIVQYTITAVVPEGTTIYAGEISDTIPAGLTYFEGNGLFDGAIGPLAPTVTIVPDPADAGATAGNADPCGDPTVGDLATPGHNATGDVVLSFPCDYQNAIGTGDDIVEITFYVQVDDVSATQADPAPATTFSNQATFAWENEEGDGGDVDSNTVVTEVVEPNPEIVKDHTTPTPPSNTISPGGGAVWQLTITNPSTTANNVTTLHDLVIVDTVPVFATPLATPGGAPVTATGDTIEGPGGAVGLWETSGPRTITWSVATPWNPSGDETVLDELAPDGAPIVIDFEVEFADSLPASADIVNEATVTGDSLPPEDPSNDPTDQDARPYEDDDDDSLEVAIPTLTKDVEPFGPPDPGDDDPWTVGQPLEFSVTYAIPSQIVTFDTTLFDTLPTGLTFDQFGNSLLGPDPIIGPSCSRGDLGTPVGPLTPADLVTVHPVAGDPQVLAWFAGDVIAVGGTCEITVPYTVHVDDAAFDADTLTNEAIAVWNHDDQVDDDDVATDGDLPSDFDDPSEFVDSSGPVSETVAVVEPQLELDKDVQLLPGPTGIPPCDVTGGNDTASSDDPDGTPGPNPAGTTTGDGCDIEAGSSLRYTLTIDNTGTSPAHDITVVDTIPIGLDPIHVVNVVTGASGSVGTWDPIARTISWTLPGPLADSGTTIVDYDVTVAPSDDLLDLEDLQNTADIPTYFGIPEAERDQIVVDNPDNDDIITYGNDPAATRGPVDEDDVTVEVYFPDPNIEKTHVPPSDPADARVDEPFTWQLTITNLDTVADLFGVDAVDNLPPGWTYVPGSAMVTTPYNGGPVAVEPSCAASTGACADPNTLSVETLTWTDLTSGAAEPLDSSQQIVIEFQAIPQSEVLNDPMYLGVGNEHVNTASVTGDDATGSDSCCGGETYEDETTDEAVVNVFDLALRKTVSGMDTLDLGFGTNVTFSIEVFNQGNVDATDVTITDYVPTTWQFNVADNTAAATGNANSWDGADPLNPTLDVGAIPAGGSVIVDVVLELLQPPLPGEQVHNYVEISEADDDGDSGTAAPNDVDSQPDDDDTNDELDDDVIDELGYDGEGALTGDDEDDHDIASLPVFDLALVKTVDSVVPTPLVIGSLVTFDIEVINQGSETAYGVEVTDYVQPMFVFDAANNTAAATGNANDWDGTDPLNPTLDVGTIAPGSSPTVTIVLEYIGGPAPAENRSEISEADDDTDPANDPPVDVDSRPDQDDDDVVIDDEQFDHGIDGDGNVTGEDEDDHDIALLPVFDLALRKTVASAPSPVVIGSVVEFDIEVTNQGSVDAFNVEVTDHIQSGFAYDDTDNTAALTGNTNDWDGSVDPTAPTIVIPSLPVGATTTVRIRLVVDNGTGDLTNIAEISEADDDTDATNDPPTDVDSVPDDDPDDDALEDDETGENGRDDTTGDGVADQDDHDIAGLDRFDLALRKTVIGADPPPLVIGSIVEYQIEVFNQGDIDATDIVLTDYVAPEFIYDDADNTATLTGNANDWDGSVDPTTPTLLVGDLAAGDSTTVVIRLQFTTAPADGVLDNGAEISGYDDDGDPGTAPPTDIDSTPDQTDDDPLVDDEILDDGDTDEDDHDIALLSIFDLALRKTVAGIDPLPMKIGSAITYDIEVFNQGGIDATDIVVTDYIHPGLSFDPALNPTWDGTDPENPTTIVAALSAQSSTTVSITLTIVDGASTLDNDAEISAADDDGDPTTDPPTDIDSTPDGDPDDDPAVDDEIGDDGTTDQDDHDITSIPVFDLAVRKNVASVVPEPVADGAVVTFAIEVFNQGSIDATDIELTDTVGTGFAYADVDNRAAETGNDNNWDGSVDPTAPTLLVGDLAAGESTTVFIVMTIPSVPSEPTTFVNQVEISSADDDGDPTTDPPVDIDSDPDGTPDDLLVDDETGNNGSTDEDDHDIAEITTPLFDLALTKRLTGDTLVDIGDDLTFVIEVVNQGDIAAIDIEVSDYLPDGLSLATADTNGWVDNGDGTLTATIAGPIEPGASDSIELVATVGPDVTGDQVNVAEISGSTDINGIPHLDGDSNPDTDPSDDAGGDPSVDDNVIDGAGGDEDDHDPALFRVREVDLQPTKTGVGSVTAGDVAAWTVTITNNGPDPDTGPITAVDQLPDGLSYRSGSGDGWDCAAADATVTCVHESPLDPGQITPELTIETDVAASAGNPITNEVVSQSTATDIDSSNDNSSDSISVDQRDGGGGVGLAFTGTTTRWFLVVALLSAGLGLAFVFLGRRRKGPVPSTTR